MHFDEYLAGLNTNNELTIHPSWGQGRTTFGGMSAGLLIGKMLLQVEPEKSLRSVNINFSGPLICDQAAKIEVEELSIGKGTSQLSARCIQDGKITTLATTVFAKPRFSSIAIEDIKADMPEAGSGQAMGYMKGITPEFVQHIDFTYLKGQFPFTASDKNEIEGWMRFNTAAEKITVAHIVMLIDAWPPTSMQKLKKPAPASSISWNLDIAQPMPELKGDDWLYYHAEIKQSADGYSMTEAEVRHPNGQLIARTRQLVALYEKAE